MITSRQRSYLRGMANNLESIFQIGKGGVSPEVTASVDEALEARELVKIAVLSNCPDDPHDAAEKLSGRTRSELVQVVGKKIVLYRRSTKKPVIELP